MYQEYKQNTKLHFSPWSGTPCILVQGLNTKKLGIDKMTLNLTELFLFSKKKRREQNG